MNEWLPTWRGHRTLVLTCGEVPSLARRFSLAPLGPPVLEPNLHPGLAQVEFQGQLLPRKHVRVRGALEGPLQLLQLVGGEGRPGNSKATPLQESRKCTKQAV